MKKILILCSVFAIFACKSKRPTVTPEAPAPVATEQPAATPSTDQPAADVPAKEPATEPAPKTTDDITAALAKGKTLFEKNCNMCHGLKAPGSRTVAEWNKVVPRMAVKVNKKLGREELDASKQAMMLQYLSAHAKGK